MVLEPRLSAIHRELGISATYASERGLALHEEASASDLVEIGINDEGRVIKLIRPAALAWANMRQTALRNDLELLAVSGFRSIARQTELFRGKLAAGMPLAEILRYVA